MTDTQIALPGVLAEDRPEPIRLSHALSMPASGEPPTEFRIFPAGEFDTAKGALLFDEHSAKQVLKAHKASGVDLLPLDYDHKMLSPYSPADGGRAAGWFKPELRNGELWATDVQWTPTAAQSLRDREYRFTSPALFTQGQLNSMLGKAMSEKDGHRIVELINVALTNLPAMRKQKPLVNAAHLTGSDDGAPGSVPHSKEASMKTLLSKLDLPESATEAEAVTALDSRLGGLHTQLTALLTATGVPDVEAAVGVIAAGQAALSQVTELSAKLAELETQREQAERASIVTALKTEGKLTPAQEQTLVPALSLDALRSFAQCAPVVLGKSSHREPAPEAPQQTTRLQHDSKTYEQLSAVEKTALRSADREAFEALRNDWITAGRPAPNA